MLIRGCFADALAINVADPLNMFHSLLMQFSRPLNEDALLVILTHLVYRANAKKRVISNDIPTVLKARGKRALADVNCYCKMTSIVKDDVKNSK